MTVSLYSPARRLLFAIANLGVTLFYLYGVTGMFRASLLSSSAEPSDLERAVQIQPSNADYHHLLGRYLLLVQHDAPSAVASLTHAVALNPHVARYWLSLALAYEVNGDREGQGAALEGAIAAEPTTPGVAWEVGNFYIVRGDIEKALAQFRVVMERDPARVRMALEQGWRASGNVDQMLDKALPPQAEVHLTFLEVLAEKQQTEASRKVWASMKELKQPVLIQRALPYVAYLIREHEVDSAWHVWRELLALNGQPTGDSASDNLVGNPGFENRVLNGGFDWTYKVISGVKLAIDTSQVHAGVRSLSVEFGGNPVADAGLYQYIRVEPNTDYHFSAHLRSEDIFSARGPTLLLEDAYDKTPYFESSDMLGSSVWQEHQGNFRTGASNRLLIVRIVRNPGTTRIRGRFWIDDVRLNKR